MCRYASVAETNRLTLAFRGFRLSGSPMVGGWPQRIRGMRKIHSQESFHFKRRGLHLGQQQHWGMPQVDLRRHCLWVDYCDTGTEITRDRWIVWDAILREGREYLRMCLLKIIRETGNVSTPSMEMNFRDFLLEISLHVLGLYMDGTMTSDAASKIWNMVCLIYTFGQPIGLKLFSHFVHFVKQKCALFGSLFKMALRRSGRMIHHEEAALNRWCACSPLRATIFRGKCTVAE